MARNAVNQQNELLIRVAVLNKSIKLSIPNTQVGS